MNSFGFLSTILVLSGPVSGPDIVTFEGETFPEVDGWLKNLLEKGVAELNENVKEEGNDVRDDSSQDS